MGAARESLERTLQLSWSFDELAVYSDLLQSDGDPRGELLALDLQPMPDDPSWVTRRRAALVAWLGEDLAASAGHLVQHGFVHELRHGSHPPELLDSPLGPFIRGYAVWGGSDRIARPLADLASRRRPWLTRLTIASWDGQPCSPKLAAALVAATPQLAELHLVGRPAFREFPHPALRQLWLDEALEVEVSRGDLQHGRRRSDPYATGWRIERDELARFLAAAEQERDCNQLYARHVGAFADPVPTLLARARAAGMLDVDGPIVRPMKLVAGEHAFDDRFVSTQGFGNLFVDVADEPETNVGSVRYHGQQLQSYLDDTALPAWVRKPIVEYLQILQSLAEADPSSRLARQRTLKTLGGPLGRALHALVEMRALRGEPPRDWKWEQVETLATLLAIPGAERRVELRVA